MADSTLHIRVEDDTTLERPAGVPTSAPPAPPPVPPVPPDPPRLPTQAENLLRTIQQHTGGLPAAKEAQLRAELAKGQLDGSRMMDILERFTAPAGGGPPPPASQGGSPPPRPADPPPTPRPGPGESPPKPDRDPVADAVAAAQDIRDRLGRGAVTLTEAFDRLDRAIRRGGDELTDALRDRGTIDATKTAADYFRRGLEQTADGLGLPGERGTTAEVEAARRERERAAKEEAADRERGRKEREKAAADAARERERQLADREKQAAAARVEQQQRIQNLGDGARAVVQPGQSLAGRVGGGVQMAAAGAFGSRAAAMAAGPPGMILTAALAVKEAIDQIPGAVGSAVRAGIGSIASVGQAAARNDGFAVLETAAEGTAKVLDHFGLAGKFAGEAVRTFAFTANAAKQTLDALANRGKELAGYDGRIAEAVGLAELRRVQSDIREAQKYGAEYARLIQGQQSVEEAFKRAIDPLKMRFIAFAERMIPLLEGAATLLEAGLKKAGNAADGVADVGRQLAPLVPGFPVIGQLANALDDLNKAVRELNKVRAKQAQQDQDKMVTDALAAVMNLAPPGPPDADPAIAGADRQLRMPIVGGP